MAIGHVETYDRPLTDQAIGDLEIIPRRKIEYKARRFSMSQVVSPLPSFARMCYHLQS